MRNNLNSVKLYLVLLYLLTIVISGNTDFWNKWKHPLLTYMSLGMGNGNYTHNHRFYVVRLCRYIMTASFQRFIFLNLRSVLPFPMPRFSS